MLKEEIKKAIEKSLPQQVGTALKERLLEAENNIEKIAKMEEEILTIKKENLLLRGLKLKQEHIDIGDKRLATERESLHVLLNKKDVWVAKLQQEEAEKRACQVLDLVRLVFKSPVYTREINKTLSFPGADSYGNSIQQSSYENSEEIIKSKE